jgi:excisionase family DNA binding protein
MKGPKTKRKPVFKTLPGPTPLVSFEPILTIEDVAQRLRIEPRTVYELTRKRAKRPLPVLRVGKFLRFRWSHIEKWLDESLKETR